MKVVVLLACLLLVVLAACTYDGINLPVEPQEPRAAPTDAELSRCEVDADCIPIPSQCHPERCINSGAKDFFSQPEFCTEIFISTAAYKPEDCACNNGMCENKNKYVAESNLPPGATACPEQISEICTMEYRPVCGWFKDSVNCITEPCAITESNPCTACANPDVAYWTEGACGEA